MSRIRTLIDKAKAASAPVIWIQHDQPGSQLAKGSAGWQIVEQVRPSRSETVIEKQYLDAFADTPFRKELDALGVGHTGDLRCRHRRLHPHHIAAFAGGGVRRDAGRRCSHDRYRTLASTVARRPEHPDRSRADDRLHQLLRRRHRVPRSHHVWWYRPSRSSSLSDARTPPSVVLPGYPDVVIDCPEPVVLAGITGAHPGPGSQGRRRLDRDPHPGRQQLHLGGAARPNRTPVLSLRGPTMTIDPEYQTRLLTPETWDDFAGLVEANNGVWGGCWCMGFHPEGAGRVHTPAGNRAAKRPTPPRAPSTRSWSTRAMSASAGASSAPPPSCRTSRTGLPMSASSTQFRPGGSDVSSPEANIEGGGWHAPQSPPYWKRSKTPAVGSSRPTPSRSSDRPPQRGAYLHTGPESLYEEFGFQRDRRIAKWRWVMRLNLAV